MPKAWSAKDERQYEHVKASEKRRGRSTDRAEEIAARTVNKQRREEGRTPNWRTQGTGNPNRPLESRTRDELYNRAKELGVPGRSRMTKAELLEAVQGRRRVRAAAMHAPPRTRRRTSHHHDSNDGQEPTVITMRHFIDAKGLSGSAMPAADNPLDAPVPGARHYRVTLRRDGHTFETYCSRPPSSPAPETGDALAEVARRVATATPLSTAESADPTGIPARRAAETERLRAFLGQETMRELVFEFGHRSPDALETGDPVSNPARPEEMTNQEPEALRTAAQAVSSRAPLILAALPPISLAAGAALFARGNYRASALSLAAGVTTAVAGAQAYRLLGHRRERAQEMELQRFADEHASIQAGA